MRVQVKFIIHSVVGRLHVFPCEARPMWDPKQKKCILKTADILITKPKSGETWVLQRVTK